MISEETLTFYYYDDGLTAAERQAVEKALGSDPDLSARYETLCRELDGWSEPEAIEAPSHLVQQLHESITTAANAGIRESRDTKSSFGSIFLIWGGAIAAALVVGFGFGNYFSTDTGPLLPPDNYTVEVPGIVDTAVPASFTRGLQVHLQDSQREIAELPVETSANRTALVLQIIEQNRVFERTAELNNSDNLARVLRAFEPILLRLANEDMAPADAEALRAQLAFELNVMLTKLANRPSKESHST